MTFEFEKVDPQSSYGEETWTLERCIRELDAAIRRRQSDERLACMRAMNRLGCWHEAIEQFLSLAAREVQLGSALMSFWTEHGFHIACSLREDTIFLDALRKHLRLYRGKGRVLYRGELFERHRARTYGIAWTADLEAAERFAERRMILDEGAGVVLRIDATSEMIVAGPTAHSRRLQENEYLVDVRMIGGVTVVPQEGLCPSL